MPAVVLEQPVLNMPHLKSSDEPLKEPIRISSGDALFTSENDDVPCNECGTLHAPLWKREVDREGILCIQCAASESFNLAANPMSRSKRVACMPKST